METLDLSNNDAQVLTRLFDPDANSLTPAIDTTLPPYPQIPLPLLRTLQSTELQAIRLASTNDLSGARTLLTTLTSAHPTYASAYNNLAQVLRLLDAPAPEILTALNTAIELAAPATPLSPARARLLAQAYTQRGALLYGLFSKAGEGEVVMGMRREQLEGAASKDFWEGGRYGSGVGREMAVKTNEYARLCGAMVKEALTREYAAGGVYL